MSTNNERLLRRDFLRLSAAGALAASASGWLPALADDARRPENRARHKSCILLWMNGGPSQMDTFDPKPGHKNGGPVKPIDTSVPGVQISEFLPKVARQMKRLAVVRSMSTKEADHTRATYLMRTGREEANLLNLNEEFQHPYLPDLIARKVAGPEKGRLDGTDLAFHEREFARLHAELESAYKTSPLPENPSAGEALHDLLVRVRLKGQAQG
jgi:hypothetical protein